MVCCEDSKNDEKRKTAPPRAIALCATSVALNVLNGVLLLFLQSKVTINNLSVTSISSVALFLGQIVSVCFISLVSSWVYGLQVYKITSLYLKFCFFLLKNFDSAINVTELAS